MKVKVLGPVELEVDGEPMDLGGPRQRTVLSLLLANQGRAISVDRLVDEIWGETPPTTAAATLQSYVSRLRAVLGANSIRKQGGGYAWALPPEATDAVRFEAAATDTSTDATSCREALSLWRGRPFDDVADTPAIRDERHRLEELRLSMLERCIDGDLASGRHAELVSELENLVTAHPFREKFAAQLMLALYRSNRQAEALRVFSELRRRLAEELGLDPSPELAALEESILLRSAELDAPSPPRHNLPSARNRFVGRQSEREQVAAAMSRSRLVTLTGAGGSGKTRMALELSRSLLPKYPDGVWWVELGEISDPHYLPDAVAASLGLSGVGGGPEPLSRPARPINPIQALVEALEDKEALLVLDNCEHLVDAVANLADALLTADPDLHLLATSREPLRVEGEVLWPVPPLSLAEPDDTEWPDAIALFVERARSASPGFDVHSADLSIVAGICLRLDGMPLAIELAAAQVRAFGLDEIATRLDDRFRFLTGGARTAPSRLQSLRSTVEWSYQLLTDLEQACFARLSLFRGWFTLQATEAVMAGDPIPPGASGGLLGALVDKSMVETEVVDGSSRHYRLTETLREFARARLAESIDGNQAVDRFTDYYLSLAENGHASLHGPDGLAWLKQLRQEQTNLQAALDLLLERSRSQEAIQMAGALGEFWLLQGSLGGERNWLERALAGDTTVSDWRGRALTAASKLAWLLGDRESATRRADEAGVVYTETGNLAGRAEAIRLVADAMMTDPFSGRGHVDGLRQAIAMFRAAGDRLGLAQSLLILAEFSFWAFDFDEMRKYSHEAHVGFEQIGDRLGVARALVFEGRAEFSLGKSDAPTKLRQALAVFREADARPEIAWTLYMLAEMSEPTDPNGDALYRHAVTEFEALGSRWARLVAMGSWGWYARMNRQLVEAGRRFRFSLEAAREQEETGTAIWMIESIAGLATEVADPVAAAQLFGFASHWREEHGNRLPSWDQPRYDRDQAAVKTMLDPDLFEVERQRGRSLSWDQATGVAVRVTERVEE